MFMLAEKVIATISPYLRLKESVAESMTLDEAGVDSARLVDIVLDLEVQFGIHIEDSDIETFGTIGDIITLVTSKQS
jgi:acyl carrier protein